MNTTKKKRYRPYFGFEIECEYNPEALPGLRVGSYHSPVRVPGTKYWKAESDGSIHTRKRNWRTAEFTSIVVGTEGYKDALREFQKLLGGTEKPLKKVVGFNTSMGAHIHLSLSNIRLKDRVLTIHDRELFTIVNRKMQERGFSKSFIDEFNEHYWRSYSQHGGNRTTRYNSLNVATHIPTIEWRSFNLLPVSNWLEFHALYEVGIESLLEFVGTLRKTGFKCTVNIDADETTSVEETNIKDIRVSIDGED